MHYFFPEHLFFFFFKLCFNCKVKAVFLHSGWGVGRMGGTLYRCPPGSLNLTHPRWLADPDCDECMRGCPEAVLSTLWTCKGCLWNPPDTMRAVLSLKHHQSKGTAAVSMPWRLSCQAEQNHTTVIATRCGFSYNMVEMKGLLALVFSWLPMLGIPW